MDDELSLLYGKLYLDQDVPVQLAGMLRAHGFDVLTTLEAGMLGRLDPDQLAFAVSEGRAMVTHNRLDYEQLHEEYLAEGRTHCGIFIAPQRREIGVTRDRILRLLNTFDHEQLQSNLYYT